MAAARTRTSPGIALALAAALVLSACPASGPISPGNEVRDFRLETLDHGRFYFADHRGRVGVLLFFSTICLGCKEELAALSEMARELSSPGLWVAAACVDSGDRAEVQSLARGLSVTIPVLLDPGGKLFSRWGFREVPATVVIAPDGRVDLSRQGYDPAVMKQIRARTQVLLESKRRK